MTQKMKTTCSFIIHISNTDDKLYTASCKSIDMKSDKHLIKEDAIDEMLKLIKQYLNNQATAYLNKFHNHDGFILCPEADLILPVDVYHCKLQHPKEIVCPLLGEIDINNKQDFFNKCLAKHEIKEQKYKTVQEKKYKGAHHQTGKGQCGWCRKYYYDWELAYLGDYYNILDDEFRRRFLRTNLPVSAYHYTCPDCFTKVVKEIDPNNEQNFIKRKIIYFYE